MVYGRLISQYYDFSLASALYDSLIWGSKLNYAFYNYYFIMNKPHLGFHLKSLQNAFCRGLDLMCFLDTPQNAQIHFHFNAFDISVHYVWINIPPLIQKFTTFQENIERSIIILMIFMLERPKKHQSTQSIFDVTNCFSSW